MYMKGLDMRFIVKMIFVLLLMQIASAEEVKWNRIAFDDLGVTGKQPYLFYSDGNYRFNSQNLDDKFKTVVFGDAVEMGYADILPTAQYRLKLSFLCDEGNRRQSVEVNGEKLTEIFQLKKDEVTEVVLDIPQSLANKGSLRVVINSHAGANAVLSVAELFSSETQKVAVIKQSEKDRDDYVEVAVPRYSPIPVSVTGTSRPEISLDGIWKFSVSPESDFEKKTDHSSWADIVVPGEWSMQGFNVEKNAAAGYFRTFTVPADWKDRRIKLRFNAVYSKAAVFINGQKVGGHLGGFTAFELDITDHARVGQKNTLALQVTNESLADSLASGSQYACHPLGGIPRSVSIIALPEMHISGLAVQTDFDASYRHANLTALLELANEDAANAANATVNISLSEYGSNKSVSLDKNTISVPIQAGKSASVSLENLVSDPKKWNCETPNLYILTCTLSQNGKEIQTIKQRFGFREIEVRGSDILVNGMPVALRGINRHEVYPLTGRTVPKHLYRKDIELFREANANLIRTSHYPPDKALMEVADELGMFIECEGPFCWAHAAKGWSRREVIEATVRQNLEMVQFLRNHPSILFWSLGNESHWSRAFEQSAVTVKELDPTRPVGFDTWGYKGNELVEIGTNHYPGLGKTYGDGEYPLSLGEYCHLNAYNRFEMATDQTLRDKWGIYLSVMWELMYADPTCVGGAIWAGIDDTFYWDFKKPDGQIEERTVGYGTWGPIDGWRRKKPEYWGMKKTYSPVRVNVSGVQIKDNKIVVPVENRQDFSNLDRLNIRWQLGSESGVVSKDIAPRSKGELKISPKTPITADADLYLAFDDPRGFNVDSFNIELGPKTEKLTQGNSENYVIVETDAAIQIKGQHAVYNINRKTGLLENDVFTGPYLMVLPLNGSGGTQMHGPTNYYEPYTHTCKQWQLKSINVKVENDKPILTVSGSYKEASGAFVYTFNANGTIDIDYDFEMNEKINPRQIGIVFELPATYENLSWKRKGHWTTYPDWHIARLEGTANASYGFDATPVGPRTRPGHEWRFDRNKVGNHDFASTKHNIYRAMLADTNNKGLVITANADRHVRAWREAGKIRVLAAHYSNGGSERFLRRIANKDDRPLDKGDHVKSSVNFKLIQ